MRIDFERGERAMFAARLGLEPSVGDESLAEASAEYFSTIDGRAYIDQRVGTPDDDHAADDSERLQRMRAASQGRRMGRASDAYPKDWVPTQGGLGDRKRIHQGRW